MQQRQVFNRYLTRSEEKQLFSHVKKFRAELLAERDYHWMLLLRHTGLRIHNLACLSVDDAWAVIRHPANRLQLADADSKGGNGYELRFNSAALTALRCLLRIRRAQGFHDDGPLVMSRQGAAGLSVRSFQQRMRQWVLSAGLPRAASPHWFRHTLAKRIIETTTHNNPLQVVQCALGHSDIKSTAIYTRPDIEEIDRALELAR